MSSLNRKIAIVLPKLTFGGTERTAVELSNYMVKHGWEVTILLMFKREISFDLHREISLVEPDIKKERLGKVLYLFYILYFLRVRLIERRPDVILGLGYIALTLFSSLGLKSRVVVSFRSNPLRPRFPRSKLLSFIYNIFQWVLRNRVDGMIAQTERAKDVFKKRYACPIVVIPNFLRNLHYYETERLNQIVNIGHCSSEKGQHYLIKAFANLDNADWNLLIIGDGPLKKKLQILAESLGVGSRVLFLGYQKDIDKFLLQSKIFAFTSIVEGYPNALLEAMATPLPCVSFDCEMGPSEIIKDGENGFLVEVGDIQTFSVRLKSLIDSAELRENMQQMAGIIRCENGLTNIAPKYIDFFEKTIFSTN